MRWKMCLFLLLTLFSASCGAAPWRQVAPAESGFTVQMLGKPLEEKEVEKREDEKLLTYTLTLTDEVVTFIAGYSEISKQEAIAPINVLLDGFRDGMRQMAGKKLGERDIKLQEYSGRAVSLKNEDGLIFRSRSFVANRRIYYVLASSLEEDTKKATPTIEKFLSSLQLFPLPPAPATEWKKFSSDKGHFSALFPGVPKQKIVNKELSQPSAFSFVAYDENAAYLITYVDYNGPQPMPEAEQGLQEFQAGMLKGIKNATLLSVKNITRNQWPGRELQIKDSIGIIHQMQLIAVKQRMFTLDVVVAAEKKEAATSAMKKFFESFEFEAVEREPQKEKAKGPKES